MRKCSQCGQSDSTLTTFVNLSNMEAEYICYNCQAKNQAAQTKDLEEIDKSIADYEDLEKKFEKLIKDHPDFPEPKDELSPFLMTPLSVYKGVQNFLAALKSRRMELLTEKDSQLRLEYELKKALENEEFEEAAEIQKKIRERGEEE